MLLAQHRILCRHARSAVIEMADTQVLTTHRDHRCRAKTKTFSAQNGRLNHIESGLHAPVSLQPDFSSQSITPERLLYLSQTKFPGRTRIAD